MLTPESYREVYLAAPDGVLVVTRDGIIRDLNPAAETIFQYDRSELLDQPVDRLVPESLRKGHARHRERYVANPHPRPMGAGLELEGLRKDGSRFPVEISLASWTQEGTTEPLVVCTVRDVTERQRLRDFSRGALRSVEDERKRIARELHDDTAQRLVTLMLRLALLEDEPEAERRQHIEDVRQELLETVEAIKRIARGLRPPELEDLGLVMALHAHFRNLREASGLSVRSTFEGEVEQVLDLDAKLVLYRIIQESLNNVARHSGADSAAVSITVEEDAVHARVEDDGRGFSNPTPEGGGGMGLVGMQERALMLGGWVTVTSRPGDGTRVEIRLPMESGVVHA